MPQSGDSSSGRSCGSACTFIQWLWWPVGEGEEEGLEKLVDVVEGLMNNLVSFQKLKIIE